MALDPFAIVDNEPNQISEALLGFSLDIKVDTHRRTRKFGIAKHVDHLIANGQRLQRVIAHPGWGLSALTVSPGPKRMRKLGKCEHSLAGVSLDSFFAHASQETEIVLSDRLVAAAIAKSANATMIIQQQSGRSFRTLQALGVAKENLRLRQGRPETNPSPGAVVTEIDDPAVGKRSLDLRQKNRPRGEQLAI